MPLRCLLFTSDEAIVEPISQVLNELGVEAEPCQNSVDAVERITTQLFQIVIADWQDQPEAAFLLKTVRDLKATARPLTLAIVTEAERPQALQNGANSVLLKPIRPEQARDTLSTACELLKAKMQPHIAPVASHPAPSTGSAAAAPKLAPASITQAPEKIRAGEILHSAAPSPGGQFETEAEKINSEDAPIADPVEAAPDLISAAASVQAEAGPQPEFATSTPLTGWAALQARLTKPITFGSAPAPNASAAAANPKSELLGYESPVADKTWHQEKAEGEKDPETESGAAKESFSYALSSLPAEPSRRKFPTVILVVAATALVAALAAVPRSREMMKAIYGKGLHASLRWLNPPPAALPPTVTQHDSFGQAGDEYKLPAVTPIPDATTDPSQINVLPVVDPTAKADKNAQASDAQPQVVENTGTQAPAPADPTSGASSVASQATQAPQAQGSTVKPASDPSPAGSTNNAAASPATAPADPFVQQAAVQPAAAQPAPQPTFSKPSPATPRPVQPVRSVSASQVAGIPSSLRTHIAASTTPESVAPKGPDTSISSIEPVSLPESSLRQLLAQSIDPQYPDAARAGGQKGSVVLQVLIGRDGSVQDAKFVQGSFLFARAAIDAVKQWQFKPYAMNGRPVSVQSTITLYFKPPA